MVLLLTVTFAAILMLAGVAGSYFREVVSDGPTPPAVAIGSAAGLMAVVGCGLLYSYAMAIAT
ncbi:hypothetical protein [Nocardia sp. 348MFTsu5.1]|uniref:hypothetical protein n=1 Tax=Nocardia sp. 348MFTsu5.1 TaxID=1172185 RepID=UPI0003702626|nr:hypothetical protein [Nocardia sp. 348MFTsu5.1]